ncbi:kinase 1, variant 3 [Balamuthia mandrillaris]
MEDGTCKVCDFGSATTVVMTPNTQKEISWVEDNIQKYTTVPYRAPEMLDLYGHKTINHKVDVWALGCLLYKLMFLETPFEENSQLQILNVNYTIPEDSPYTKTLHSLIKFILNPDPDKRPEIFEVLSCVSKLRGVECPVVKIAHEKVIEPPSLASTMNEDFLSLSDDDDHLLFPTAAALKQQQQQRKQSASSSSSNDNNGFSGKRTHKVKRASTEFVGKSSGSKSKKTSGSSSSSNGPSPSASPRRREKKPSAHHKQKRKEGLKMSSTLPMSASSPENSLSSSPNNNSPEVNSTLFSMLDWHENNNTRPSTMASSAAVEASTSTTLPQIQITPSSPIVTSASAPSASPPSSPSKKTPSGHHRKKKEDGGGSSEVAASSAAKETRGEKSKGEGKEGEEREAIPSSASSSALRKSGKKHNIFKLKEHGGNLFKHKHKNKDKDQQQTKDKDGNETPSSSKEEKKSKRRSLTMALKKGKGLTFIVDDDSAHAELPPSLSAPPTPEPSALKGKKKKHLSSSTKQKNAATPVATPTKKKKKENKRDKEDNNRTSPDETTLSSVETVTTPSKSSSSSSSSSTDKRQHSKGSSRRFSVDSPQSKEMMEASSSGERARRQLQYSVPAGKRSLEREQRANQRGSKEASPSSSSSPSPSASAEVATKSSSSPATPRSASNLADAPLSASSPSLPSSASSSADITANNVDVSQTAATPPSTPESSSPSLPSSTTGEQQPQQSSQPSVVEQYCLCLAEATTPQTLHMDMQQLQNAITLSWTIQGSISTLDIVSRLTLGHSLVYFKSLAVLHVLMSEGHPSILAEASNNIQYFTNLNTHFLNHQQQGITTSSRIIGEYAVYIIKKLQFHSLHPQYEGNYSLDTFFVSMLSAGMSFSVGDGTPVSKEVAAQALDLLSDITTLGDLIFKGGESPSSFISCIVPLLQEAYSLFLISTYIFSKLIYAEQMYALKPLITYYQQLFKNLRKFYKRAATLSLPFTMPSLPETVPVFSPHQPIRIRPPVTNIHETKLKADQLKEQALLAQQHQQLLQQQQYLTLQQQQMEAAFAALSNDTSSSPSSPSFDSASMPRPSFPSPSLSSASSSSENNKIEAQKDGNKPAKSSTLLATTFHRNQLPPSVSSSSSLQEAEEGEIDPNEFFPEDVPFGATPRFPDDEKEVEDKEDDKNKEVVNNNKEEDLNNINDKHSKKKSTKKKKKSTTKSKQPQEATTGDESKSDK